MRQIIKDFAELGAKYLPILEPIYEFGSFQVPEQAGFADLRPFFAGKEYVGTDMREGPGVDKILNLHGIDLPDNSVGTVLLLDTLEHVEYPRKALSEVYRILKPGGIVIMSSVMNFPIHDYPYDYWRYTPKAFESLLQGFQGSYVTFAGNEAFPHTVVACGIKEGAIPDKGMFIKLCNEWQEKYAKKDKIYNSFPQRLKRFIMNRLKIKQKPEF